MFTIPINSGSNRFGELVPEADETMVDRGTRQREMVAAASADA